MFLCLVRLVLVVAHLLGCMTLQGVEVQMLCSSLTSCCGLIYSVICVFGLVLDSALPGMVYMPVPQPLLVARTLEPPS